MENKNEFEYALIDENNVVINIAVFDSHDEGLINLIVATNNAVKAISCDEFGTAKVQGTWNGERFLDSEGNKLPLTYPPIGGSYAYDFDKEEWYDVLGGMAPIQVVELTS